MKKLFIIPTRETKVLHNNYLYCKVYKGEELNKFNIKEEYKADAEWLLELSTDDIDEYALFYRRYIIKQLDKQKESDKHKELDGNDYKEVETAIDSLNLLLGLKYHLNYLNFNTFIDKYITPLTSELLKYAIRTKDRSLLENLVDFSTAYIRYWYNFNN